MLTLPQIAFAKVCSRYGQERRTCSLHGHCTEADRVERGQAKTLTGCADFIQMGQLRVSANGIGDVLMALTVGAGWKHRHPGKHLHFVAPHTQWAALFEGAYDSLATTGVPGSTEVYPSLANRGGLHFVEAVARVPLRERKVPALRPLPDEALEWAEQYRDCVVLAPISLGSGTNRNWDRANWLVLEQGLRDRGISCVAVGAGTDRLWGFQDPVLAGQPAVRVAALMLAARAVVSNESGMGHLGGALGVPTLVLAAQLIAAPIYAVWPSVKVIQGPLPCGGCRWTGVNYLPACRASCANLQAITPEAVLASLEDLPNASAHEPASPDAALSPSFGAAIEDHLRRLIVPLHTPPTPPGFPFTVADRRLTMRAFLRHIAVREMCLVVETGCQRQTRDYGAGMSTTLFGLVLAGMGRLVSLDNDARHVEFCRKEVAGLPVEVVQTDSRDWLRTHTGQISALYLDSADVGTPEFSECCLEEAELALPHLAPDAVILIDDTVRWGSEWWGKGKLAVPYLLAHGWRVKATGYQTLLERA